MQKNNLFLLMSMFLCISFLQAQKATLTGKITDKDNGEPLIAATILAGARGAVSDIEGVYSVSLDPGTYKVEVSYVGYQPFTQSITLQANENITLDAALTLETSVLQTATVTSGKYQKPLSEVTVSLEVLRPNLIENTSKLTIDDALEKVPGVSVVDGQANIRGGSGYSYGAGSRVLLMVDDIPILQADAGFPNWDDVPIENIEQVEIVKGAASSLYGSSALNGIINIRSALPKSEPETRVAAFYTHFFSPEDERKKWWDSAPYYVGGSISHRQKFKKLDLVLGSYYLKENSFNKDTYKDFGRFNFNTTYRVTDRFTIGLNGNVNKGESGSFFYWQTDTTAYEPPNDTTATVRKRFRYNLDPHITYFDQAGNRHKFLGRFYKVDNDNSDNQSNESEIFYGEYQFQKRFVDWDLVMTTGFVGQYSQVTAELYGDTTFSARNLAAYVQLEKEFWDRLNVSAGFRFENNLLTNPGFESPLGVKVTPSEDEESQPVFRLGVNFRATDYTYLRASWGQGYRYPTIAEKYIVTDVGGFL
ncbi:MAG: TonB-dependent receptor [Saprospiraceae bacterium]|nr:TonB-dependent receptor [Saprospiraceae bacterium]